MGREGSARWLRRQLEPEVVRRRTHRGAVVMTGVFAVVVALALLRPGVYSVGPVDIKLTSLRNPLLELGAAIVVTLATARLRIRFRLEVPRTLRSLWSAWPAGGRLFALAVALKVAVTVVNVARLPDTYLSFHRAARRRFDEPLEAVFDRPNRYAQFEGLFERCRRELPPDARVLYNGRSEGQLLAYVLYPRPVFMHPVDSYVAWVGHQVLDLGPTLPPDELFPGSVPPPLVAPGLAAFVESRRITHEVRFVESDLRRCRIEALR